MNQKRVGAVLENLENMGLSQILITDPVSVYYLTGKMIAPMERFYALYLNRKGNHRIFINQLETVPEDLGVEKVRFGDTDPYMDLVIQTVESGELLGVDKNMAARFLLPLQDACAAKGFVNASSAVDQARGVKDEEEQLLMRQSSKINDAALTQLRPFLREGVTERECARHLTEIYQELGADGLSFEPLIAFGANAASGHHNPDDSPLRAGDCVLIDAGCMFRGYCSDMTRTWFYKDVSDHQAEIYNLVLRANESAEQPVAPGVALCELDAVARGIISDAGYGEHFTHRLGHFIGLEDHEAGEVSATESEEAVPGNIFSVEPGIYLEGDMGVRIEDLVLVTRDGYENLNRLSKALEIIP